MTVTEYAVLHTPPGEKTPILIQVGDELLQRQTLFEFLEQGGKAKPATRQVTEWTEDEATLADVTHDVARASVVAIAQDAWEESVPLDQAVAELAGHSPHNWDKRAKLLGELISELEHQESVDRDEVAPGDGEDKQSLAEDAERRINEAAGRLIGSTS
jgi:hypothetical protein